MPEPDNGSGVVASAATGDADLAQVYRDCDAIRDPEVAQVYRNFLFAMMRIRARTTGESPSATNRYDDDPRHYREGL